MRVALLAIGLTFATAALADPETVSGPIRMTKAQIERYNASLAKSDPAYIVCISVTKTGSLIAKTACRTRGEWDRLARIGGDDAREWVDYASTHQFGLNEEPAGTTAPLSSVGN